MWHDWSGINAILSYLQFGCLITHLFLPTESVFFHSPWFLALFLKSCPPYFGDSADLFLITSSHYLSPCLTPINKLPFVFVCKTFKHYPLDWYRVASAACFRPTDFLFFPIGTWASSTRTRALPLWILVSVCQSLWLFGLLFDCFTCLLAPGPARSNIKFITSVSCPLLCYFGSLQISWTIHTKAEPTTILAVYILYVLDQTIFRV